MTRYSHNHRDANEQELIKAAARMGAFWLECGPLDGKVWIPRRGHWSPPIEIKIPEREGTAGEYTPLQKRFFSWCRQFDAPWWVWRTVDDVIRDLA